MGVTQRAMVLPVQQHQIYPDGKPVARIGNFSLSDPGLNRPSSGTHGCASDSGTFFFSRSSTRHSCSEIYISSSSAQSSVNHHKSSLRLFLILSVCSEEALSLDRSWSYEKKSQPYRRSVLESKLINSIV